MRRAYMFRLRPTVRQHVALAACVEAHRELYNAALQERRDAWVGTYRRFSRWLDWSGYEDALAYYWHAQLHVFQVPFYYIEYGVAQMGALQIWLHATRANAGEAVARYRSALALGGARPLPQLFEAAGARLAFDEETVAPLARALGEELAKAPYA